MSRRLRGAALAVWDFIVGDDWTTAVAVAVAIGVTAAVAALGAPAWWVMPAAVLAALSASLRRGA